MIIKIKGKKLIKVGVSYYIPVPVQYLKDGAIKLSTLYDYDVTLSQHENANYSDEKDRFKPKQNSP